jgi:NAD(P)-dependent dehydrogenase (short-subunit alcohol dehydrogenase family)
MAIKATPTDDDWLRWWGVNVHGVFYCIREALKFMEPKKYGRIINIASTGGISVSGANISVNCIAPGGIDKQIYGSSPLRMHRIVEKLHQAMQNRAKIRGLTFWKAAHLERSETDFGRKVPAA